MVNLEIAGVPFEINNKYDIFDEWACSDHKTEHSPIFEVSATEEEMELEVQRFHGEFNLTQCESNILYRKVSLKLLDFDAFLLHAAVVAMDGRAYAFTAASGTGKSTHARYWLRAFPGRAHILNGDKPILKLSGGAFYACGTPWRGKEKMGTAECIPLKAVYLLERGSENSVSVAVPDDIIDRLVVQTLIPSEIESINKQFDLLNSLIEIVPIYKLQCNMSVEAATTAYEGVQD